MAIDYLNNFRFGNQMQQVWTNGKGAFGAVYIGSNQDMQSIREKLGSAEM